MISIVSHICSVGFFALYWRCRFFHPDQVSISFERLIILRATVRRVRFHSNLSPDIVRNRGNVLDRSWQSLNEDRLVILVTLSLMCQTDDYVVTIERKAENDEVEISTNDRRRRSNYNHVNSMLYRGFIHFNPHASQHSITLVTNENALIPVLQSRMHQCFINISWGVSIDESQSDLPSKEGHS